MANRTPIGAALAFQRDAARMGQRTVEEGVDAQRAMTEAFVRNTIGMGRAANRSATEATRQSAVTVASLTDATTPGNVSTRTPVEHGFDAMADAQENAWRVVEESVEDGLATYAQLTERGMRTFAASMGGTMDARERTGRESADAAVEYERQRPENVATRSGETEASESAAETIPVEEDEGTSAEPTGSNAAAADAETAETGQDAEIEAAVPEAGLEDISGIGSSYAARLRGAGIDSVTALRDADVAELSESTEISDERIANWQRQARHLLESGSE